MSLTLQDLGLTTDELIDRVVAHAANTLLTEVTYDDEGDAVDVSSPLQRKLRAKIQEGIDMAVDTLLAKHIMPLVENKLDTLLLVQTNRWGERKSDPLTFIEYATERADAYLTEQVNYDGKSQKESGGYSWNPHTTRVVFLANKHLQYSITKAMEKALADVNGGITGGIEAAVKQTLAEVQQKLKIEVKV